MVLNLESLTINYFMSFGPDNTIELKKKGLVLINGINEISDAASSNGAGKTNLQEAIAWCLYGKTTKGVPAADVVNNIWKKDCFVTAVFSDRDRHYRIARYRKHSIHGDQLHFESTDLDDGMVENLAGVDTTETQSRIDQFLGCGFTLFCNSSYFSQNNVKPFSTFTDKDIKEVFIDALDMGRFSRGLEKTRFDLKTLREELATLEGRYSRNVEEIKEAEARKADYQEKHNQFDIDTQGILDNFDRDISRLETSIETLTASKVSTADITAQIVEHTKTLAKLPHTTDTKTSLLKTSTDLQNSFNLLKHRLKTANDLAITKERELAAASKRIGTNCFECGKPIGADDLAAVITGLGDQIKKASADAAGLKALIDRATPKLVEYQTQEAEIETIIEECRKAELSIAALKVLQAKNEGIESEIKSLRSQIVDQTQRRTARAAEKSPWQSLIDREQETITASTEKADAVVMVIDTKQEEIGYIEYWENACGYAGIPSFLLDTVTPVLNERANHYASIVTGGEIEIEFATVTKTKKGELKDKFAINISHQHGAKMYKGISGGERKRADVCIAQSIQDLVRNFGRNPISYCSYDEPFENLDTEGVSSVIEMLQEVSKEIGTVLVVTHNSELKAMFDSTITVVKGKDGYSRIA